VAAGFVLVVVALVAGLWMLITQPYWPILVGACVVVLAVALAYRVSRYLAVLQAPHKELVWFNSGHGANHTAATEWNEFLIDHVLGVEERAQAPR
jgi:NADH:ubiquinone oxidoreductase subunit 3 (subunit A)